MKESVQTFSKLILAQKKQQKKNQQQPPAPQSVETSQPVLRIIPNSPVDAEKPEPNKKLDEEDNLILRKKSEKSPEKKAKKAKKVSVPNDPCKPRVNIVVIGHVDAGKVNFF